MEVRTEAVYEQILNISSTPPVHPEFSWTVTLFTPTSEINLDDTKSLTVQRMYIDNFSDESILNFVVGIGTYVNQIYPHKANLKVEVLRQPLIHGTRDTPNPSIPVSKETYRAILVDQSSLGLRASSEMTADEGKGDRSKRIPISLQLVEPLVDDVRTRTISGIFSGTWSDVLKALCRGKLRTEPWEKDVDLELVRRRQQDELAGVDVREPDNAKNPKQLLIPVGTRLVDLPGYIQGRYGLYNHSLGSYVERGCWYIWGLNNTDLFDSSERTVTVAIADTNTLPTTDNSFSVEDKHVKLVATGEVNHRDDSESALQDQGNGLRYQDANKLMDKYAETKAGVTSVSRANNLREFLIEEREDGYNTVNYADRLTSNHHAQLSTLNSRRGSLVSVNWHNSDPDVLRPGVPARILYNGKDGVRSIDGILVAATHSYTKEGDSYTDTKVRCNSLLVFWVKRDV